VAKPCAGISRLSGHADVVAGDDLLHCVAAARSGGIALLGTRCEQLASEVVPENVAAVLDRLSCDVLRIRAHEQSANHPSHFFFSGRNGGRIDARAVTPSTGWSSASHRRFRCFSPRHFSLHRPQPDH
jgi:hypothetical protein